MRDSFLINIDELEIFDEVERTKPIIPNYIN
jgi:hypothetical protein